MALANKARGRDRAHIWTLIVAKLVRTSSNAVDCVATYLTIRRITAYLLIPFVVLWIPYSLKHAVGSFPDASLETFVKSDFLGFYASGKFALDGHVADIYSVASQRQMQLPLTSAIDWDGMALYISPPVVAYLYAPFAALPYSLAAVSWLILTIVLVVSSLRLIWSAVPNIHSFGCARLLLVLAASYPAVDLITSGQNSAITLVLMALGLRFLLAGKNGSAGAVLGLGVYKPQLFILFPLFIVLEKRWRALLCWSAVAAMLFVTSVSLVGVDGVRAYVSLLTSDLYYERILGNYGWKMSSVGSLIHALLPPALHAGTIATSVNMLVLATGALILTKAHKQVRRFMAGTDAIATGYALTVLISVAFAPHVFNYDNMLLILPFMVLLNTYPRSAALKVSILSAYIISMTAPFRSLAFSEKEWPLNILAAPWTVVPVVVCLFVVLRQLSSRRDVSSKETSRDLTTRPVTAG